MVSTLDERPRPKVNLSFRVQFFSGRSDNSTGDSDNSTGYNDNSTGGSDNDTGGSDTSTGGSDSSTGDSYNLKNIWKINYSRDGTWFQGNRP